MFCGLNGRTFRPRLAKARAKPATIRDFPTSEPVPWNMSARAATSELDAGLRLHAGGDRVQIEIFVAQRDVELVEDHEGEASIGDELERLRPGALGRRDVARKVLRLPGEALPHRVPGDLVAEGGERIALRRVPRAFDELHHAHPVAAAEHA